MAVSAFRSTTRRSCQIGSAENSAPVMPGSRPEVASQKGAHRRSRSSADFSQKYLSDSEYGGRHGGRSSSRYMSSDSESDMDGGYSQRRYRRRNFEFSDGRDRAPSVGAPDVFQRCGIRRTSSYHDLSSGNSSRCGISVAHDNSRGDPPEDFEEEKTIKAVYAQIKSRKTDPLPGDFDAISDAMRAEVRRAVADIRMELEQSMKQSCSSRECSEEASTVDSMGTDVIQAVTDIRKEYAAKLEQSEKRVRELWSELAVEERRCLEFAKIVKELLPAPTPPSQKMPRRRKGSAEKQLVSKWLDEEAHKYLEECVSISSLESGDLDTPYQEKDQRCQTHAVQDVGSGKRSGAKCRTQLTDKNRNCQKEDTKHSKSGLVENDGVVLPWLQWEADPGVNEKKSRKGGKTRPFASSGSSRCTQSDSSNSTTNGNSLSLSSCSSTGISSHNSCLVSFVRNQAVSAKASTDAKKSAFTSGEVAYGEGNLRLCNDEATKGSELIPQMCIFSAGPTSNKIDKMNKNLCYINAEEQMLERIRLRHKRECGELILCMGLPF